MATPKVSVKGTTLVIEVDISPAAVKAAPPSSSGKTRLVSTTGAAMLIPGTDGVKLQLSCYVANSAS